MRLFRQIGYTLTLLVTFQSMGSHEPPPRAKVEMCLHAMEKLGVFLLQDVSFKNLRPSAPSAIEGTAAYLNTKPIEWLGFAQFFREHYLTAPAATRARNHNENAITNFHRATDENGIWKNEAFWSGFFRDAVLYSPRLNRQADYVLNHLHFQLGVLSPKADYHQLEKMYVIDHEERVIRFNPYHRFHILDSESPEYSFSYTYDINVAFTRAIQDTVYDFATTVRFGHEAISPSFSFRRFAESLMKGHPDLVRFYRDKDLTYEENSKSGVPVSPLPDDLYRDLWVYFRESLSARTGNLVAQRMSLSGRRDVLSFPHTFWLSMDPAEERYLWVNRYLVSNFSIEPILVDRLSDLWIDNSLRQIPRSWLEPLED